MELNIGELSFFTRFEIGEMEFNLGGFHQKIGRIEFNLSAILNWNCVLNICLKLRSIEISYLYLPTKVIKKKHDSMDIRIRYKHHCFFVDQSYKANMIVVLCLFVYKLLGY